MIDLNTTSDNIWKLLELSTTSERMRLGWSQQILRFSGEGTGTQLRATDAKEYDVQEKFKI